MLVFAAALLAAHCLDGGARATWSGLVGARPVSCRLCSSVVVETGPLVDLSGRCKVKHFAHRKRLGISIASSGRGFICRRYFKNNIVPPCTDPECVVLPRTCCRLDVPSSGVFDADHPPTSVDGTYTCPNETGVFMLRVRTE